MSEGARKQNEILRRFPNVTPEEVFGMALTDSDTEVIEGLMEKARELEDELGATVDMVSYQEHEEALDMIAELEQENHELRNTINDLQFEIEELKIQIAERAA